MKFKLRPYQEEASKKAVEFFLDKKKNWNALEVLPTASGKSLILADIAARLKDKVLVFSPTKEILEQNYKKYCSYGFDNASIYSASFKSKEISDVTFATIGSVKGHPELFTDFKYILIDEVHLVKPESGMYKEFLDKLKSKVIGLTATPFRLYSYQNYGSILKFLTRFSRSLFIMFKLRIWQRTDISVFRTITHAHHHHNGTKETCSSIQLAVITLTKVSSKNMNV